MPFDLWLLLIGALLLAMALAHPALQRLPVTPTMVYLLLGVVLSPAGVNVLRVDPAEHHGWLLRAAEISVIISLFTVGMKLRLSPRSPQLRPALCLASVSMILTVGLIAAAGVFLLDLPLGAAVLLGAVLAPTDPVLASDVQMRDPSDQDKIRLTLSAEAGLNDGTAFPFVMLGLGLLGYHELGAQGWRWWTIDVAWAIAGGLAIGGLLGTGFGRLLLWLQARRSRPLAFGEYLVLGLIGVSYGAAIQLHAYGFLSVFAAGLALRAIERRATPAAPADVDAQIARSAAGPPNPQLAADPITAPAYFAGVLLATNEQLEHILEVALVLIVGATLATVGFPAEALWFAPLLFFRHPAARRAAGARHDELLSPGVRQRRVVRHPRHRLTLLSHVCDRSGLRRRDRSEARRSDARRRGAFDRRARHLGHAPPPASHPPRRGRLSRRLPSRHAENTLPP